MAPVTALAATVSGLARYTWACLWPIRPGKLRFVVLMHASGSFSLPNVSAGPPRQAAHDGSPSLAPADRNTSSSVFEPIRSVFSPAAISDEEWCLLLLAAGTNAVAAPPATVARRALECADRGSEYFSAGHPRPRAAGGLHGGRRGRPGTN